MKTSRKSISNRQSGGLLLNIGIGIGLGLLAALAAVLLVMRGGPFKDHQNSNALEQSGASTDPNAPLYGPNVPAIANVPAGTNAQGDGVGALTSGGAASDTKANTSATVETAKPVETPSADPVGAMIDGANKGTASKPTTTKPTDSSKPNSTTLPKEVKPTTAPTDSASSAKKGNYTIQAGAFSSASEAAAMRSKLAAQGQSATISEKKTADGTLYRVRVGNYGSDKEAQAARSKVGGVVLELGK